MVKSACYTDDVTGFPTLRPSPPPCPPPRRWMMPTTVAAAAALARFGARARPTSNWSTPPPPAPVPPAGGGGSAAMPEFLVFLISPCEWIGIKTKSGGAAESGVALRKVQGFPRGFPWNDLLLAVSITEPFDVYKIPDMNHMRQ